MKTKWMAEIVVFAAAMETAYAAEPQRQVTVWLENAEVADPLLLARAESEAVRIFAQVDVKVAWKLGAPGKSARGEILEMVFDTETPARFAKTAMGFATPGAKTTAIHLFYRRIVQFHSQQTASLLLGHVMAHEMTHVLEGVARHSDEGLMKAFWNVTDYYAMSDGPLPFAQIDVELIRAHFERPTVATAVTH